MELFEPGIETGQSRKAVREMDEMFRHFDFTPIRPEFPERLWQIVEEKYFQAKAASGRAREADEMSDDELRLAAGGIGRAWAKTDADDADDMVRRR